jgi:hypothetical protein
MTKWLWSINLYGCFGVIVRIEQACVLCGNDEYEINEILKNETNKR